ncbi:MAG: ribosome-associated translation inhibitor RaiA [Proteobacteria bacterium]|nr:ribosome-associated translation inhibitor RaiA [Pseudomonadota bacterium]
MHIIVKGKNVDVTDALRAHAEKRVAKITRYFDRIISTDVTLSTERNWHIVEVTVHDNNGHVLRGEERTDDMYSSIDKVIEKLERQVKRQKGKTARSKARGTHLGEELELSAAAAAKPAAKSRTKAKAEPTLDPNMENVRRFDAPPMSVEQAVKELESTTHPFYVFNNSAVQRINVLYRTPHGYGLVDPIPV